MIEPISRRIVLASSNAGKLRELNTLLAPLQLEICSQGELQVQEVEETGLSFVENAILKARAAAAHTGLPAIADDSGLEVDALAGAPGIYSARYAGSDASDAQNNARLLRELANTPDSARGARFQCCLVFLRHQLDPTPLICQGSWEGQILRAPQGDQGFGYDPLFVPTSLDCSSAELRPAQKNRISHRAIASRALLHGLRRYY